MRAITNTLAMAGVAGALMMGALAPAAAQTSGWNGGSWSEPHYRTSWNEPYYGSSYGPYRQSGALIEAPVAGRLDLDPAPYGGTTTPYAPGLGYGQCTTDEGYGRFQPCDHGGQ